MRYQPWVARTRSAVEIAGQQRRYERRAAEMRQIKLDRGCDDCGYDEHPQALEWDHRPNEVKSFNMSSAVYRRPDVVEAEMAKCDLRCANCHRVVTAERRTWSNGRSRPGQEADPHPRLWEESA